MASILIAAFVIGGAVMFASKGEPVAQAANVRMEGETQVIEIDAKGGYAPKLSTARADVPTVLRVKTSGTYDCSAAIRIPSLGYSTTMEPSGVTEVTVPPQKIGSTLQGVCAMGMYSFQVTFEA